MWNDFVLAFQNGFRTTMDSLKYLLSHPKLIVPTFFIKIVDIVLFVWFFGFTSLGNRILDDTASFAVWQLFLIAYLMLVTVRLIEGIATMMTLSMVKQNDQTYKMGFFKALVETLTSSLWLALPVILFWALIEFIIHLVFAAISAMLNRDNKRSGKSMAQRALDRKRRFIQRMIKLVSLFSYPIVVWDKKPFFRAIKESFAMFKSRFGVILTGTSFLGFLIALMWLPPFIIVMIAGYFEFLNLGIVIGLFVYMVLLWSIKYLIETLFITKVFLWYRAWQKACDEAKEKGKEIPSLNEIPKPDLLYGYSDILLDDQIKEAEAPEPM